MAVMCQQCSAELQTWTGKCPNCGGTAQVEMRKRQDPMIEKLIGGRYKIAKKLGQGGMGSVYLGEHVGVGQKVAIKFLAPQFSDNPDVVRRFLNEARSYGQVTHPHAVHLHDFGQDEDGNLYISMEYIEGQDLKKTLEKNGPFSVRDACDIVLQICDVLGYAHAKNIVHRDMKPENVMVTKGMRGFHAKVLDFGIARLMDEQTRLTAAGSITGTPRYMSPEQAEGKDVDLRTDIYALGIVLFELLTGKHPYPGNSIAEILRKQVMEPMPHLADVAPELGLPEAIDAVIQKATAKEREQRYPDMTSFARSLAESIPTEAQLQAFDRRQGVEGAQTAIKLTPGMLEKTSHGNSPYAREAKKSPAILYGGAVMGVALLAGVGFLALKPAEAPAPRAAVVAQPPAPPAPPAAVAPQLAPPPAASPTPNPQPAVDPGQQAAAIDEIRRVADGTLLNEAHARFDAGDLDVAESTLKRIPGESAVKDEAAALTAKIAELRALMTRGNSLLHRGDCDGATKVYGDVLKKNAGMSAARKGIAQCKSAAAPAVLE